MTSEGLAVTGVSRATLGTLGRLGLDGLLVLLIGTVGTNLLDFATVPAPGAKPDARFVLAALIRVIVIFWVSYAVQRRLVGRPFAFRPSMALLRFSGLQIALLIGFALATRLAIAAEGPPPVPLANQWLYAFLATALFALATLRLLAWNAALAAGEPFRKLGGIWRGQAGRIGLIAIAFIGLVLPISALHLALTLVGVKIAMLPHSRLTFAIFDGLVQALQLAVSCALGAVALRLAGPIDAIARPR